MIAGDAKKEANNTVDNRFSKPPKWMIYIGKAILFLKQSVSSQC
tara:strand:+ start:21956 stop:22087 length:132 start_codon:yes stop_codon:yes gene_type:complete